MADRKIPLNQLAEMVGISNVNLSNIKTGKIYESIKSDVGNAAMVVGGQSTGRVGVIVKREVNQCSFEIVHNKDTAGKMFTIL